MLQFLETWTGARALNITDWRRSISGDLTAAFDFENPDFSIPNLPDTVPLITQSDAEKAFPKVATPPEGQQSFPVQEAGTRPHRPAANMTLADVTVNRTSGLVTAKLSVRGKVGVSLAVYPDNFAPPAATQFTVTRGHDQHYTWDTTLTGGNYAFSVYGPDGFLSSFAGAVVPASKTKGKVPKITARQRNGHKGILVLTLENDGHEPVTYSLTPGDYSGQAQSVGVARGHKQTIDWPANADGYYDVTVTADSGDGFLRRYAGRIF
jgi:phospholipase C